MEIITRGRYKALALSKEDKLQTLPDVLDLIPAIWADECQAAIIPMECLPEAFFDLKTGFAGEVLQKFTNYHLKFAVIGDFLGFASKSLRDFMYESNKGHQVFFKTTTEDAMAAMEKVFS